MTEPDRRVVVEVTVAAPAGAVWEALREPGLLRRWHGWEYDGLDAEIDEIYGAHAVADEAARTLDLPGTGDRFELLARGDETVVRVTRAASTAGPDWDGIYDPIREGWITFVHQLRFALERHPGEERRTAFLERAPALPDAPGAPGERYAWRTPWGEALAGEVWFRTRHQLGLTVDAYGDGLAILEARPGGGGHAVLTGYGLRGAGGPPQPLERRLVPVPVSTGGRRWSPAPADAAR